MENLKAIFQAIKSLPKVGKILSIIAIFLCIIIGVFFTSCGITQSTINNVNSPNASHTMTVDPAQSTSVSTSASVGVDSLSVL